MGRDGTGCAKDPLRDGSTTDGLVVMQDDERIGNTRIIGALTRIGGWQGREGDRPDGGGGVVQGSPSSGMRQGARTLLDAGRKIGPRWVTAVAFLVAVAVRSSDHGGLTLGLQQTAQGVAQKLLFRQGGGQPQLAAAP